jgi:hypothetical protein
MSTLEPSMIGLLAILAGTGAAMVRSAARYNLLEHRREHRRCASCGRLLAGRRCRCAR